MLGGGTFNAQNKVLPGAYINFVSAANAMANIGERGYAAMALPLKWGIDDEIFTVTANDFRKNCLKIFGFEYASDEAKGLRDLFKNITTLFCYKLMKNGGYAANSISKAKYKGSAGTKIATEILDGTELGTYDVNIYFGTSLVFSETVSSFDELNNDENGWVVWTIESLTASTKTFLSGTSLDGEAVTAVEHAAFLDASEAYSFNAMGCISTESAIKELYVTECKEMRDNAGIKYQLVVFDKAADYEGIVNVKNSAEAVYWVTGVVAGCEINASNTNKLYDGEFDIPVKYTKAELETAIKSGQFTLHKVGDTVRVLEDINSLTTTTDNKGEDFKANQTVRVVDQIAMDIAGLFNTKYLGQIPNDASGRISLWNDVVKHHQELEAMRAIENFNPDNVIVEQGETKKSVVVSDAITVVNAMNQLYMSVVVQ